MVPGSAPPQAAESWWPAAALPPCEHVGVATWKRWLRYVKAAVDAKVRSADRELERREADLEAERTDKPWLDDEAASPSYDEVQRRIDAMGPTDRPAPPADSGDLAFDLAAQQRAAAERLEEIRESLDVDPPER